MGIFTAEEPLDIAGVIDAPPQRCFLSKIVDSDLVICEIRCHVLLTEPGRRRTHRAFFFPVHWEYWKEGCCDPAGP